MSYCKIKTFSTSSHPITYLSVFNLSLYHLWIICLQKRALRFMYSTKKNEHTIPLFINAKILPLNFLYYKTLSELMHDVSTASAPIKICNLFTKTTSVHAYNTHSSTSENFYIKASRLEIPKKRLFKNGC